MDFYRKTKPAEHFLMTSQPRKVYDLEHEELNCMIWVREKNKAITQYLECFDRNEFCDSVVITNGLEEKMLEDFFKNFPKDHDDLRKGHELLKNDIMAILKMITPLNPKRYLEISLNPFLKDETWHYSESEINIICSYTNIGMEWVENNFTNWHDGSPQVRDDSSVKMLGTNHVAIFKGIDYPGSLSPFVYRLKDSAKFLLKINSYLAEH